MAIARPLCYNGGAMTDWLFLLKADPLPYLLAAPEPAVRWWTLRDLLDRPAGDPEAAGARLAAWQSAPTRTILAAQRPSGAWATDRHLYTPKHTATTWQLDILADLGFTVADEPVRRACTCRWRTWARALTPRRCWRAARPVDSRACVSAPSWWEGC